MAEAADEPGECQNEQQADKPATRRLGDHSGANMNSTFSATVAAVHSKNKRDAFSELMSRKPSKSSKTSSTAASDRTSTAIPAGSSVTSSTSSFYARHSNIPLENSRAGLFPYIQNPAAFPSNVVIRATDHTVLIRDLYPKATIHLLLLPRSPAHYNLHPHDAFADSDFLNTMKSETASAIQLAASELSRLASPFSASSRARNEAMEQIPPPAPDQLPPGRDFVRDLRVGIHAHPSMSHLHIHIISVDMHSAALKHRKHYNSFNTDFFIPLADYPLADDDQRRSVSYQNANLKKDFVCWRCGQGFGNKFARLKEHLEAEYQTWRAE